MKNLKLSPKLIKMILLDLVIAGAIVCVCSVVFGGKSALAGKVRDVNNGCLTVIDEYKKGEEETRAKLAQSRASHSDASSALIADDLPDISGTLTAAFCSSDVGWHPDQTLQLNSDESIRLVVSGKNAGIRSLKLSVRADSNNSEVSYSVYTKSSGWQNTEENGNPAGDEYGYQNIEAVMLWLSGDLSESYDIWYRAYVQNFGWLDWTYNGAPCGSKDLSLRMEALEISILKKNAVAPGGMERPYMDEKAMNAIFEELKKEYPAGSYWNHMGVARNGSVTKIPCDHMKNELNCNSYDGKSTIVNGFGTGRQCAGFASMLSDRIFGKDAPAEMFYDYNEVCVGDQVRMYQDSHTALIIGKTDEYIVVAECNADYLTCKIDWGRKVPRSDLDGYFIKRR